MQWFEALAVSSAAPIPRRRDGMSVQVGLGKEIAALASDAVGGILCPVPRKPRRRDEQNLPELIGLTWVPSWHAS